MSVLAALSIETGISRADLASLASTAPWRYKVFPIEKKNGRGTRVVAQPSRELKLVQRALLSISLSKLRVHEAAHGYVAGKGIKSNALLHKDGRFLMKMDFANFFPSIVPSDFFRHIAKYPESGIEENEAKILARFLFWSPKGQYGLRLCIGAPTSPLISNSVMFDTDVEIDAYCKGVGVVYSRYADDITFSTSEPNVLSGVYTEVKAILARAEYPRLSLNELKTVNASKAHRRVVTGLVLSAQSNLSLGRERKREIRSLVHRASSGLLDFKALRRLHGLLAFASDIEPEFAAKMRAKMPN